MKTWTGLVYALLLYSCSGTGAPRLGMVTDLPSFAGVDSIELYVYPDPDNQRIFSRFNIGDTVVINTVVTDLAKDAITPPICVHYKKLYLFHKGEVFKTIYVSDSCRYLAYVVNGGRVFRPMSGSLYEQLEQVINDRRQQGANGNGKYPGP